MRLTSPIAGLPGARELFEGVWWLPGQKLPGKMASASLLLDGPEPLLVDTGLHVDTAARLRETGIVKRVHLTHMHLDHRMHQDWFVADDVTVTVPEAEREAIADWDVFFSVAGFPERFRPAFDAWRRATCEASAVPQARGLEDGGELEGTPFEARLLMLPGHTAGHSGLWFPELRAALVTDYDMEDFGPWYGNTSSDLEQWIATLEWLMARDDLDWYITSHSRGMLDRETFLVEAQRYLRMIDERDDAIVSLLGRDRPREAGKLVGNGVIYPPRSVERFPVFSLFEHRMLTLHMERLERRGVLTREPEGWRCA